MQTSSPIAEENVGIYRNRKDYIIILLTMLYVTSKLTCNPIFFRQTEFNLLFIDYHFKITCAAFIFPSIYILSDTIIVLANRKIASLIIIFGIICDGVFSFTVSHISGFRFLLQCLKLNY